MLRAALIPAALIPATLILFVLVSAFLVQVPWATGLWPWPAKPLSYIFIASILAAIAVPVLWIAVSGEAAAIRAGALDLAVMYGGMFVYVLTLIGNPDEPERSPGRPRSRGPPRGRCPSRYVCRSAPSRLSRPEPR